MTQFEVRGIDIAFIQGQFTDADEPDSFLFEIGTIDGDEFPVFATLDVRTEPGRVVVGSIAHLGVVDGSAEDLSDSEVVDGVNDMTLKGPAWELMSLVARQVSATMKFAPFDPDEYPTAEVRMHSQIQSDSLRNPDESGG